MFPTNKTNQQYRLTHIAWFQQNTARHLTNRRIWAHSSSFKNRHSFFRKHYRYATSCPPVEIESAITLAAIPVSVDYCGCLDCCDRCWINNWTNRTKTFRACLTVGRTTARWEGACARILLSVYNQSCRNRKSDQSILLWRTGPDPDDDSSIVKGDALNVYRSKGRMNFASQQVGDGHGTNHVLGDD